MVSIAKQRQANGRAWLVLLAAALAPPAISQQADASADDDREEQIVARIEQEQARNGARSSGLVAPLSDLALHYQDRGEHVLAVAVIREVLAVIRANEGLYSLEQAPHLQQLIENEEAIGRLDTAWELGQELLRLARRHPDDLRTVAIFRAAAEKRMTLLARYAAGEPRPEIILGCYYGWPQAAEGAFETSWIDRGCLAGSRDGVKRAIVSDAQRNYADAIAVLLRNGMYANDEAEELELALLHSIDVIRARDSRAPGLLCGVCMYVEPWKSWWDAMRLLDEWDVPAPAAAGIAAEAAFDGSTPLGERPSIGDYLIGRQSLERILAYRAAASAPLEDRIEAFVRIADWDLLYSRNGLALEEYERAYRALEAAGAQASIERIFAPQTPVILPALASNPLASDAAQGSGAYLDVGFEVMRSGVSRRARILESANATRADETRLTRLIESIRFRPRVTNGEFATAPVRLRYYLSE